MTETLTAEEALERLVVYTAMENAQLAMDCERVLKPLLRIAANVLDDGAVEKVARIMSDTFNQQVAMDHADDGTTIIPTSAEDWTQDAQAILNHLKGAGDE